MKISSIKAAGSALINGIWVPDIPNLPGVRLKVCGANNPKARSILQEFFANMPRGRRTQEDVSAAERLQILDGILVDWDGITDDDGTPVPYSRDKAEEWLNDPEISVILVDAVAYASAIAADVAAKDADDLLKN